jgi:hypothetical protein
MGYQFRKQSPSIGGNRGRDLATIQELSSAHDITGYSEVRLSCVLSYYLGQLQSLQLTRFFY